MTRLTPRVVAGLIVAVVCARPLTAAQSQLAMPSSEAYGWVKCSDTILKGAYAVKGDGYVQDSTGVLQPWSIVSLMKLDGTGGLSNKVSASFNGLIQQNTVVGGYTVNADCTGTITVTLPAPPFQLTFDLVVADARGSDAGDEFYFISTNAGTSITHTARRIR